MPRPPDLLFVANWPRTHRSAEDYAFFAHWSTKPRVRFLGTFELGCWTRFEKRVLRFYVLQALVALLLAPFHDAVIAYSTQSALPLAALLRVCFWMRTKLIVFDVETFGRARHGLRRALVRFAARRIDHVVYASRDQEAYYDEVLPFLRWRRTFVALGIGEFAKQLPFDAGRDGPLVALGKQGAAFRDWATLLRAYALLSTDVELHIVGRDDLPPAEREYAPLPPGVKLIPYQIGAPLHEMIERARCVILPLPERGQSLGQLSLLLAMALGKATVAARIIGLTDYLADGVTGLFYQPGDAADLARCVRRLLDDPALAEQMGRAGRAAVEEKFNDRRMARDWEEVFGIVTGLPGRDIN
jgi:glycosyltransferase involved in cell wall biosynthesis